MKELFGFLAALALVVLCVFLLPTEAQAASESDLTFMLNDDGESYSVTDCNESASGSLTIPATYNGKPVTGIDDDAFRYCSSLTSITIPNSVTSIGAYAFSHCNNLTSITIPDSVTSIDSGAFYNCSKLSYNTYGNAKYLGNAENPYMVLIDVTSTSITQCTIHPNTKIIGYSAFYNCDSLTGITIPNSVTSIGSNAFVLCRELTSIVIPDSVTSIGTGAFHECSRLTSIQVSIDNPSYSSDGKGVLFNKKKTLLIKAPSKLPDSYVIPDSVTSIGNYAFIYCSELTSVVIPDSVTSIGSHAFSECSRLTSIQVSIDNPLYSSDGKGVLFNKNKTELISTPGGLSGSYVIPDSVTSIGDHAFYKCSSLTSITIPDSVTSIGSYAFNECSSLTSVTIGNGVTNIDEYAFNYCTSLTSIVIPDSITCMSAFAFTGCSKLSYNAYGNAKYLGNAANPYMVLIEATSTSVTQCTIHPNTKTICSYAFRNCSSLTNITIPDGVTSIGNSAFSNCSKLLYNTYDNAKYLGNSTNPYVVLVDTNSTSITFCKIHKDTKVIYNDAFYGCSRLTSITIPDGVTSIGAYAFSHCNNLTSITIPDSVTSIGSNALYNCSSLTSITIPDSVTSIGSSAFYNCSSLTSITIPDSLTSIGTGAFNECNRLTSIQVSIDNPSYSSDGKGVLFNKKKTLLVKAPGKLPDSYVIPDSVTSIGESAFSNCSSLTNITIPSSVTSIGESAFSGCSSLSNVVYCGTAEYWEQIKFGAYNTNLANAKRSYHSMTAGDCITPRTCKICGETEGEPLGHTWIDATCTSKKFCFICGATEGDYVHKWVDATCLKPKHCSQCELTEGTTIPHTYTDDTDAFCNVCNHQRVLEEATLKFYSTPALSFQDYIGMQILIRNADVAKYDKVYVIAVQETPDGLVETRLEGIPFYGAYQVFNQQVVSWSMTEQVTMTLYGEINGVVYKGASFTDSVMSLGMSILESSTDALKSRVIVDMLNYGAAVQTVFDHNASNLPNAELGAYAALGTTGTPALGAANAITGTAKVPALMSNISLQAKVEIQLLFSTDISAYTAKATVGAQTAEVVIDKETFADYGYTVLRVAVKAAQMRDTFTVALYDAAGNPVTQVYNVSAEGYATARKGGDYSAVDIAMMRYGDSVKAFANQ